MAQPLIASSIENRNKCPVIVLKFQNMNPGGSYNLGRSIFGGESQNISVTFDRPGYNNSLEANVNSITLYATKPRRKLAPDDANYDETVDGSDINVRIVLNEWMYADDYNITVSIAEGLYNDGVNDSASAIDYTVTNNIIDVYPSVLSNFSTWHHGRRIGYTEITNTYDNDDTFEVRVFAYHQYGLAGLKVVATGQSSLNTAEVIVNTPSIDITDKWGDYFQFPEYIFSVPKAPFQQGEYVDIKYIAYPKFGNNPYDCSASGYSMPTTKPITHTMICDKNHNNGGSGGYGGSVAVVANDGNDGSGVVVGEDAFDSENPPAAFLTDEAAAAAIRVYNNANYGRDNCGGGVIYFQAGTYNLGAITNVANNTPLILAPFPGVSRSNVEITTADSSPILAATHMMYRDLTINMATGYVNRGTLYTYYHNMYFNTGGNYGGTNAKSVAVHTSGSYPRMAQGFRALSTRFLQHHIRGIQYTHTDIEIVLADFIAGCYFDGTVTLQDNYIGLNTGNTNQLWLEGQICAYNYIAQQQDEPAILYNTISDVDVDHVNGNTVGAAVLNNVFERRAASAAEALMWIAGDDSTVMAVNNICIDNNVVLGGRANICYSDNNQRLSYTGDTVDTSTTISNLSNTDLIYPGQSVSGAGIPASTSVVSIDTGAGTIVISNAATITDTGVALTFGGDVIGDRLYWSIKNNIFDTYNIVTDNFEHGTPGSTDPVRCGNHGSVEGCGISGNIGCEYLLEVFMPPADGINCIHGNVSTTVDALFVDHQAYTSVGGAGSGNGNYHLQLNSPAINLAYEELLLYDLDGELRSNTKTAGVYRYLSGIRGNRLSGLFSLERLIR